MFQIHKLTCAICKVILFYSSYGELQLGTVFNEVLIKKINKLLNVNSSWQAYIVVSTVRTTMVLHIKFAVQWIFFFKIPKCITF